MVDVLIGCWVERRKGNAVMNRLPVVGLGRVGGEEEKIAYVQRVPRKQVKNKNRLCSMTCGGDFQKISKD